jgi:hypothetical protein
MPNDPIEDVARQMLERTLAGSGRYPPRQRQPVYPHTWHDDYVHSWTGPSRTEKKD